MPFIMFRANLDPCPGRGFHGGAFRRGFIMSFSNNITRVVSKLGFLPPAVRSTVISKIFGRVVPLVGTTNLRYEELTQERVVVSIRNRRPVQNHIKGVHAAAMALLAETATGFAVGMNLPDDKLPLIKTLKVDYIKRSQGDMRAVASLSKAQIELIRTTPKGEVTVPVLVTDESGEEPIRCEMIWAWVPKKKD
jgi:acyl-coenzyme A thioesterase PaaI-like protein